MDEELELDRSTIVEVFWKVDRDLHGTSRIDLRIIVLS